MAILLGIVLTLPSTVTGLVGDDWFHVAIQQRALPILSDVHPIWTLFSFLPGPEKQTALSEMGVFPWWSHPNVQLSFFRPLAALTHIVDGTVFPGQWWLWHVHSIAWYAALIAVASRWYRTVLTPMAAGLAVLVFAVEDHHALPVGWLANRNALLSVTLGIAALVLHHKGRTEDRIREQLAAGLLFGLSLLAGESGIGALAYLGSWEWFRGTGGWRRKGLAVASWLVVVAMWRVLYDFWGYGAAHAGLYVDPIHSPVSFVMGAGERMLWLLAGQWLQLPDLWILLTDAPRQALTVLWMVLLPAGLGLWLWPALRSRVDLRIMALGSLLSLIPVSATMPMDRLLLWCGLGASGVLVGGVEHAAQGWRRSVGWGLLLLHGPVAALMLGLRCAVMPMFGAPFSLLARTAPMDEALEEQTLVLLHGHEIPVLYLFTIRQALHAGPLPAKLLHLSDLSAASIAVEDEHTLVYTAEAGLFSRPFHRGALEPTRRFTVGEHITAVDYTVDIRAITDDGRPSIFAVTFDAPLDSPSLRWMRLQDGQFTECPAPRPGEAYTLSQDISPFATPLAGEHPQWMMNLWAP